MKTKKKFSFDRPKTRGSGAAYVTTPLTATTMALLGHALRSGPIMFSRDEKRALDRLYGFRPERPNKKPPMPTMPEAPEDEGYYERKKREETFQNALKAWERWEDPRDLMQAGADRNVARYAEHDGMRLIAWLAKYVPEGEDPLKTLVQLAVDSGFDVNQEDIAWAESDSDLESSDAAEAPVKAEAQ